MEHLTLDGFLDTDFATLWPDGGEFGPEMTLVERAHELRRQADHTLSSNPDDFDGFDEDEFAPNNIARVLLGIAEREFGRGERLSPMKLAALVTAGRIRMSDALESAGGADLKAALAFADLVSGAGRPGRVHWSDLTLYDHDGCDVAPGSESGLMALREYRETGAMNLFLVDPTDERFDRETDRDADGNMACDLGPSAQEIDWSGFPETSICGRGD